jgi:hypothetical protein
MIIPMHLAIADAMEAERHGWEMPSTHTDWVNWGSRVEQWLLAKGHRLVTSPRTSSSVRNTLDRPRTDAGKAMVEWASRAYPNQIDVWREHAVLIEVEAAEPHRWIIEPDGAVGSIPDPFINHRAECCSEKGCHNICSHLCGTADEIVPSS